MKILFRSQMLADFPAELYWNVTLKDARHLKVNKRAISILLLFECRAFGGTFWVMDKAIVILEFLVTMSSKSLP